VRTSSTPACRETQPRERDRGLDLEAGAPQAAGMQVMVTGGAGFIGSNLVDRLLAEGHAVDVVDDLSTGSLANLAEARASASHALTFQQLDIRSDALVELMARRRPEVVFHLAAQADVRVSVERPVFDADVNILGTLRVLEGARAANTARVAFAASGGTLYGECEPAELPVKESHPRRPLSPYGVSKMAAIDYLVAYRELHAVEFSALALANVYGPRQDPHGEAGVVAIFSDRLLRGEPVTIFGDGEQTRDFVYVDDVVDAFVRAATRGGGLMLNIGTGTEVSVNELARVMGERSGVTAAPVYAPARPGEIQRSCLDPERAGIHLGWRAWTELDAGVDGVLEYTRRQAGSGGGPSG
jgi:UDP-glucose 4-epimerase